MKTKQIITGMLLALLIISALGAAHFTAKTFVATAPGDSVDVFIQDQTTIPIEFLMYRVLNSISFTATAGSKTNTLELTAGHNVVAGDFLNIYQIDNNFLGIGAIRESFQQLEVVSVATNTIRVDRFLGFDLDPAKVVEANRVSVEQNVLGTIDAPIRFELCVPASMTWDLTRIMPVMILASQPDDGLFGDIAALTNGVMYGFESDIFDIYLASIKANAGFRATAYDVTYSVRSGGQGSWGLAVRKSFNGPDKYGVAIRLEGESNDCFVKYIQDDLTDINIFRDKLMGHNTSDSPGVTLP